MSTFRIFQLELMTLHAKRTLQLDEAEDVMIFFKYVTSKWTNHNPLLVFVFCLDVTSVGVLYFQRIPFSDYLHQNVSL